MTSITLLQYCSMPKRCVIHNSLGAFLLQRFINAYNLSKPTAKGAADWKQVSDLILHCQSHRHTRYNILGQWCKITQTSSPSIPSPNTATYKNHLFLFYIKVPPRFASGSQECSSIPEGSAYLHHHFSRWPFLLLVFTSLSCDCSSPSPGVDGVQLWEGCAI